MRSESPSESLSWVGKKNSHRGRAAAFLPGARNRSKPSPFFLLSVYSSLAYPKEGVPASQIIIIFFFSDPTFPNKTPVSHQVMYIRFRPCVPQPIYVRAPCEKSLRDPLMRSVAPILPFKSQRQGMLAQRPLEVGFWRLLRRSDYHCAEKSPSG
jgi:hypothetical protein